MAKSFFSSNSTRSCHFLLQCKFNFNLVGAKNIRRRVFSPASLENNYLQRWIDKLQQMLPSTIFILFVVILRMQSIINIKVENSFDQIWGTSPTHFRLPLLRSNFQPATKSAAIIFFIFMIVIITIIITAVILVINVIMITIIK